MKKNLSYTKTSVLALILALGIGIACAQAVPGDWNPVLGSSGSHTNDAPVTQNIPANPISQAKLGGLGVTQMFVNGDAAFLGDVHIGYTYWSQAQNQSGGTGNAAAFLLGKTALAQGSGTVPTLYPSDLYINNLAAPTNSVATLCVDTVGQVKNCPVVVGVCGTGGGYRNGGSYYNDSSAATPQWAATTDTYCQTGSKGTLTLSGSTWTWTCDGQFGGVSASCSASKLSVPTGTFTDQTHGTKTWTKPVGVTLFTVELWGAGGGGGGSMFVNGGGGGAGGYSKKTYSVTSASATYTYTLGQGGLGSIAGIGAGAGTGVGFDTAGTSSSFSGSTTLTANGGGKGGQAYVPSQTGSHPTTGTGGVGGSASGGTTNVTGGNGTSTGGGAPSSCSSASCSGHGGSGGSGGDWANYVIGGDGSPGNDGGIVITY